MDFKRDFKKYIPSYDFKRPKAGFTIPLKLWLDGPLKCWASDLLNPSKIKKGILNSNIIENLLKEHESGRVNYQYQIWNILMFQSWYQGQKKKNKIQLQFEVSC